MLASGFNQDVKMLNRIENLKWSYDSDKTFLYYQNIKEWEALGFRVCVIDYDYVKGTKNGLLKSIFGFVERFDLNLIEKFK